MSKNYLTLILLIAIAILLNSLVLGMLVSQPFGQNAAKTTPVADSSPKTLNNTIPSPTASVSPSPIPYSVNIPSPYLSPTTDKLAITNVQVNASESKLLVSVLNNGSSDLEITAVYLDDCPIILGKDIALPAYSNKILALTLTSGITAGSSYQIRLLSSEGCSSTYYIIVA